MASFSGLGIGLSVVFGCILLGLIAELYYMAWYKKKVNNNRGIEDKNTKHIIDVTGRFCFRKPSSLIGTKFQQKIPNSVMSPYPDCDELQDSEWGLPQKEIGEEGLDSELIRVHNLCGPPRFLFTIKEETKEDLESDDGRSRGERSRRRGETKSLSDFLFAVESPVFTPQASPRACNHSGFNPLLGSLTEAEVNRLISSPPPKFKFLRDAEEKLKRRLIEDAEKRPVAMEERESSVVRVIVGRNRDRELQQSSPIASKVLPLPPSPLSIGST